MDALLEEWRESQGQKHDWESTQSLSGIGGEWKGEVPGALEEEGGQMEKGFCP